MESESFFKENEQEFTLINEDLKNNKIKKEINKLCRILKNGRLK